MKKHKLAIIGYGRHGKDTVCDYLAEKYDYSFVSSSFFCAETVILPVLKEIYGYKDVHDCYADRHNHRSEWFDLIAEYNKEDESRLCKEILEKHDIYCGLRRKEELQATIDKKLCDFIIWVDASSRLPKESEASCTVTPEMADFIINNNGSLEELYERTDNIIHMLGNIVTDH